jgi:hypothetical protein
MAIYFQFSLVQERMRRPSIGTRDFEVFIRQGEQAQGGHGGLPRRRFFGVWMERRKKKGRGSVRNLLVLMCARIKHGKDVCKNQAWKGCVQESSMERMCVRIKHGKNLCSKYLLQSLWTFVLISYSS